MPPILLYSRCPGSYASYTIVFYVPRLLYLLYYCILGAQAPMPPILLYLSAQAPIPPILF